jgi:hypothetical protein
MATLSKTQGTSLVSLQQVASNDKVVGSAQDVSTKFAATVFIHLGRDDTGGALAAPVEFRVEGSAKSSGNDHWYPLQVFRSGLTVPESEALSGTVNAGATSFTVASTTNLAAGQIIFIKNGTLGNSEFARINKIVTTTITPIDALTNAQTGSTLYNQGEMFTANLDLTAVGRIRLVVDAGATGRTVVVEALMVTGDSIA